MLLRNRSSADGMSLKAGGFDQSRSVVAFGIAKHRASVRQVERLGRNALRQQLLDALARATRIAVRKAEPSGGEYPIDGAAIGEEDAAIGDGEVARLEDGEGAVAPGELDLCHVPPGLAAITAGVHRQCATDGARYTCKKLRLSAIVHRGETSELRACDTGFRVDKTVGNREHSSRCMHEHHRAADASVANQQVAAESDDGQRVVLQLSQEHCKVVAIHRGEGQVCLATAAPGGMSRQRLVAAELAAHAGEMK